MTDRSAWPTRYAIDPAMAFQFLCPQGHLLQADASQMGRTINCPTCGVLFVVPTVSTAAAVQPVIQVPPAAPEPAEPEPLEADPLNLNLRGRRRAHLDVGPPEEEEVVEESIPEAAAGNRSTFGPVDSSPRLVHLNCPQGHELITPFETMGQDVLCPHCGEQFLLRYQDSGIQDQATVERRDPGAEAGPEVADVGHRRRRAGAGDVHRHDVAQHEVAHPQGMSRYLTTSAPG